MAAADEVLGISGQLNIDDIQQSINQLCSNLERVGVETDTLSQRMTKALNDIATSDGDLSTKTQQAMAVLKEAMDAATKSISDVPAMMVAAQKEVDTYQAAVQKLNTELSNTPKSADNYGALTHQLANQQQALGYAKESLQDLTQSYSAVENSIARLNGAYEALNSVNTASSAVQQVQAGTNIEVAGAAVAATGATATEAVAHAANASAATQNTQAILQTKNATIEATQATQQHVAALQEDKELQELAGQSTKELKDSLKLYQSSLKEIQDAINSMDYDGKIKAATERIEAYKQKIAQYTQLRDSLTGEEDASGQGTNYYNSLISKAQDGINTLTAQIQALTMEHDRLNADMERYTELSQAAQGGINGQPIMSQSPKVGTDPYGLQGQSLSELGNRLTETQAKLEALEAAAAKINGNLLQTDRDKEKLAELNEQIEKTKEEIESIQNQIKSERGETFFGSIRNGFDGLGEKISAAKDKVTEFINEHLRLNEIKEKIGNNPGVQRFTAEYSQAKGLVEDFGQKLSNLVTGNGKLQESFGAMTTAINGMGIPLKGVGAGIMNVTKALWAMCATPIGAVITVIVMGLGAMYKYLTKSVEGQKVLAQISAYLGSLLASLTDIVVILGKYLFHAFADATGPMHGFAKGLITTFTSAIKTVGELVGGLGTAIKGIFTMNWDTFTSGMSKMWQGLKDGGKTALSAINTVFKGVIGSVKLVKSTFEDNNLQNELGGKFNSLLSNASQAAALAKKQTDATIAAGKAQEKAAQLDIQIAENREKIYKLTGEAKDALIEETKALQKQRYDGILAAQKQMLDVQRQRNKLHTVGLEDIKKERELNIQVLRTQAEQAASTRMLTRMQEANRRKMASEAEAANKKAISDANKAKNQNNAVSTASSKYDELVFTNSNEREKVITDLEAKVADARIKAMQEGFAKTLVERERQNKAELDKINEQEEAAMEAERKRQKAEYEANQAIIKARGGKVTAWDNKRDFNEDTDDVKNIRELYSDLRTQTVAKQVQDERDYEDSLIGKHQSYIDKKLKLERDYSEEVKAINSAITDAENRGDSERVDALKRSLVEAQTAFGKGKMSLAFEELKKSPDYSIAYDDLDNASSETLTKLLKRFEKVKEAAGAVLDPESAKTYFSAINGMIDELISRDPVGMLAKLSVQLKEQEASLAHSQSILERVKNGDKIVKSVSYDKDTKKWAVSYYTLADAEEEVAVKGKEVAETTNKIVKAEKALSDKVKELASEISNLGSAIGGQAGQIVSLFGDVLNFYQTTVDGIAAVARTGAQALSTIEKASVILGIISTAISLTQKISSILPNADSRYEKAARKQAEINKLRKSVEDYRLAVLKAQQAENNWFAKTGLQSLKDAYIENGEIVKQYYEKLGEAQEKYKNKSSGLSKAMPYITAAGAIALGAVTGGLGAAAVGAATAVGAIGSAATAAILGAAVDGIAGYIVGAAAQSAVSSITYKKGQVAAIDNLRIQTRHKSFWRGQKTADLRDWVKENYGKDLFDEEGMIDADLANAVLKDYGDKLQGETKQTLEELVKLREQYDEFKEQIRDYVSEMYSPLVNDMTNAVWEWLKEGKSALGQFKEAASDTFADIAKEMLKQAILSKIFGSYKDDLQHLYETYAAGSMDEKTLANSVGKLTDGLLNRAETGLPAIENLATYIDNEFKKRGFDVTGEAKEQSATANGTSNISYEQAKDIVALTTAGNITRAQISVKMDSLIADFSLITVDTSMMRASVVQITQDISVMRDMQQEGVECLQKIVKNTSPIAAMKSIMDDMYKLMKQNYS